MLPAITLCTHIWIWVSRCNKPSKKGLLKTDVTDVSLDVQMIQIHIAPRT